MSTIIIAMLPELGHLNASLKLGRGLVARGHQIYYLGDSDHRAYIEMHGMRFVSLGDSFFHRAEGGFSQKDLMEFLMESRLHCRPLNGYFTRVVEVFRQEIEALVRSLEPDLFIIDPFVPDMALIVQQLAVPFALLNTTLFNPFDGTALLERVPELADVPELILCPAEFDFPEVVARAKGRYYLGAGVDLGRKEEPFDWKKIDPTKSLIYCSLGSQSENCVGAKRLFQVVIDAMAGLPHQQMILAAGALFNHDDFQRIPPNLLLLNHAPQLQILERANVVITHGGLNTIKETLLFGVPMVVFPSFGDQPMNAARVVYHGLGVMGDLLSVTVEQARTLIERVVETDSFRERAASFREIFKQLEKADLGIRAVEALLASVAKRNGRRTRAFTQSFVSV